MPASIPTLQTERLSLVPLQSGDAAVLHRIYQVEGVLRYFPDTRPPALERVQRFVTRQLDHWEKYGCGNWGILPAGENEIVGWAGLQYVPELDETEVGYLLARPFWGKGYATEAACLSLEFGFARLGFDHIIALVHPENIASQRVLTKCRLNYVKTISLWGIELMQYRIEKISWGDS